MASNKNGIFRLSFRTKINFKYKMITTSLFRSLVWRHSRRCFYISIGKNVNDKIADPLDTADIMVPPYKERTGESCEIMKARLVYQSRKRGMLENGLLLSTFAGKYLSSMSEKQLKDYDTLINKPTNDWDIYYWATGLKPTPPEYQHEIMEMLKKHVQNMNKEQRLAQPDLY